MLWLCFESSILCTIYGENQKHWILICRNQRAAEPSSRSLSLSCFRQTPFHWASHRYGLVRLPCLSNMDSNRLFHECVWMRSLFVTEVLLSDLWDPQLFSPVIQCKASFFVLNYEHFLCSLTSSGHRFLTWTVVPSPQN